MFSYCMIPSETIVFKDDNIQLLSLHFAESPHNSFAFVIYFFQFHWCSCLQFLVRQFITVNLQHKSFTFHKGKNLRKGYCHETECSSGKKVVNIILSFLKSNWRTFAFCVYHWFLIFSIVCPGFQNQVDSFPMRSLSSTCTGFIRFMSCVTPADLLIFL